MMVETAELEKLKADVAARLQPEARPGRNDPCYCGSGKKYKQCHMAADRERDNERRAREDAAQFLRRDLLTFARDERFTAAVAAAIGHYWRDLYSVDNAEEMSPAESMRFFDWLAFDYMPEGEEDAPRLIETYRAERYEDLSTPQQEVLDGWIAAPPSVGFELLEADGQTLYLRDLVTGRLAAAYEPGGAGSTRAGDVLLGRLVPVGDRLTFTGSVAYIPRDEVGDLPAQLEAAQAAFAAAHPSAGVEAFMRTHAHVPVHHALTQAEAHDRPPVARLDPDRDRTPAEKASASAARRLRRRMGTE